MNHFLWPLLVFLASAGAAERVTYTSGPLGLGPTGATDYAPNKACGTQAADKAWDSQLAGFNDSSLNPLLNPVTSLGFLWSRASATIQTSWGSLAGPQHGFRNPTDPVPPDVLKLKPGEVIIGFDFLASQDGRVTNFTIHTNASRKWTPDWSARPMRSNIQVIAHPPNAADWSGPPVIGDWYLAYMAAQPLGWCCQRTSNGVCTDSVQGLLNVTVDGAGWYFTPVLYLTWAADVAPSTPPTADLPAPPATPAPTVAPVPTIAPPLDPTQTATEGPIGTRALGGGAPPPVPAAPQPKPESKSKSGPSIGIIVGVVVGVIGLLLLAALVWIFVRHGGKTLATNPFMKSFSSALRMGGAAGGGAAGAAAVGGAAGGPGAGGAAAAHPAAATAASAAGAAAAADAGAGAGARAGDRDIQMAYAAPGAAYVSMPTAGSATPPPGAVAIGIPSLDQPVPQHMTPQHTGVLPPPSPFIRPATYSPTPHDASGIAAPPPHYQLASVHQPTTPPTSAAYAAVHHPTGPPDPHPYTHYAFTTEPRPQSAPSGGVPAPAAAPTSAAYPQASYPQAPYSQFPPNPATHTAIPRQFSDAPSDSMIVTNTWDMASAGPTGVSMTSFPSFKRAPGGSDNFSAMDSTTARPTYPPGIPEGGAERPAGSPLALPAGDPTARAAAAVPGGLAAPPAGLVAVSAGGSSGGATPRSAAGTEGLISPRSAAVSGGGLLSPRSAGLAGSTGGTNKALWSAAGSGMGSTPRAGKTGGGSVSGQLEPQRSTPVDEVVSTLLLAKEVLDMTDKVVANHARCTRLTTRIHSIVPLLSCLHSHMERAAKKEGGDLRVEQLQHFVETSDTVLRDVRACLAQWTGDELAGRRKVIIRVLRDMVAGNEDQFFKLNERLAGTYQSLIVALNVKHVVADHDPNKLRDQHEEDVAADLKGVAAELTTGEGEAAWESLSSEERATIREAFTDYGLNFTALMSQARQNLIGDHVKSLLIPWNEIEINKELGSGGYGTVYHGTWNHIDVAVKKLQLTVVTERAKRELSHEAYVMSLLRHPNVATSYGMVLEPPHCALVMKFYENGTLLQLLHDDAEPLTLRRKLQLANDVAKGMAYLHNRPSEAVIHGDLKPSNLLIDDDGKVVITDFGLSRVSTLTLTTRPSTSGMAVTYTAPEILADPTSRKTAAADVYAYGLVLFEIFTREVPFNPAADVATVVQHVLTGGRPKVDPEQFSEVAVPREVVELMQQCWQQVPQARPGFADIVERLRMLSEAQR